MDGADGGFLVLASASGCRRTPDNSQDRADVEQVFNKYLQSINAGDVALASQVCLLSPDVLVVTPFGRFKGWDSVQKDIYANFVKEFPERNLQVSNVSIVVAGDAAWVVYDFVFTAKRADGQPFTSKGWESYGYQRTANGWRIAHLHYSVPPPAPRSAVGVPDRGRLRKRHTPRSWKSGGASLPRRVWST